MEEKNILEGWIEDHITAYNEYIMENDIKENESEYKSESDIRTETISQVKEELANLKSEYKLKSFNITSIKYNFIYYLYTEFKLEPEAIIEKIKKDLEEIEAKQYNLIISIENEKNVSLCYENKLLGVINIERLLSILPNVIKNIEYWLKEGFLHEEIFTVLKRKYF